MLNTVFQRKAKEAYEKGLGYAFCAASNSIGFIALKTVSHPSFIENGFANLTVVTAAASIAMGLYRNYQYYSLNAQRRP